MITGTTGKVKMFDSARGFGFIKPDSGTEDLFVHIGEFNAAGLDEPHVGDVVRYEIGLDRRTGRTRAVNIGRA